MSVVIAVSNQKGGCGKTTSAINIGSGLSRKGKHVLLIDIDAQGNLSEGLGIDTNALEKSIYDVLIDGADVRDVLIKIKDGLDIIPANIDLSGAEAELLQLPGKDHRLKKALNSLDTNYDYIVIDCPPSLGQLTLNALSAAEEVYIPVQTEFFALKGLRKLIDTVEMIKKWSNSNLEITGVIGTRYDARKNLNREVVEQLRQNFQDKLFTTLIRENIALAEAPTAGKDIFEYKSGCNGAEDYMSLCTEIINREDKSL